MKSNTCRTKKRGKSTTLESRVSKVKLKVKESLHNRLKI